MHHCPLVQLPYSHLMATDRQDSVTAALAAAAVVASSAMERTRLEEEKLRVQAKDKKDQSKKTSASNDFLQVQCPSLSLDQVLTLRPE